MMAGENKMDDLLFILTGLAGTALILVFVVLVILGINFLTSGNVFTKQIQKKERY